MINTFRDRLVTTHFDAFRNLIDELKIIKEDLKKKQRRVTPPLGNYTAYCMIKDICRPLTQVFRFTRYGEETSINMFKDSLLKLHLLIQEMQTYGIDDMAQTFQKIYRRLFNLLPENTVNEAPPPASTRGEGVLC